ncbi:heterokaryon incompatibility protein-domain-containing protein [Xylaria cubensis]|nr:heterokaryon incompatibility protein-domain-containing protein [Xylaria cubensis]
MDALSTEVQVSNLTRGQDVSLHRPLPPHSHKNMYAYRPLPSGYIRVAELYPGQFNDVIIIKLHHEPFQSRKVPVYEALSYVWGSKASPSWVRVAEAVEGELQVTRNLDVALRHLRYTDRPRFIWVDAVCIDQLNNVEKGPQVAMMGEIFRLAARVVVWLGPEENDSDRALSWLESMGSQVDYEHYLKPVPGADESISDVNVPIPLEAPDLSCLYHLFCRPWFDRLWVRQEIILANRDAIVLCGSSIIEWQLFRRGCACVHLKPHQLFEYDKQLYARYGMLRGLVVWCPKGFTPNEMRPWFGDLNCEDPRDRVYAVLGLLHESIHLDIQPDYTKSATQVYEDLYTQYINNTSNLDFLSACQLSDPPSGPSWQPKWSLDTSVVREGTALPVMFVSGHFHASPYTPVDGKLNVMGVSVGRIQRLRKNRAREIDTYYDTIALIRDAFFFPPKLISSDYISGGTLLDAFTRALSLDRFEENFSPARKDLPGRFDSAELLREILEEIDLFKEETDMLSVPNPRNFSNFLSQARDALQGRCVYDTEEGFVGLAPLKAKSGDEVCVIVGCNNSPVILRHVNEDEYILVGGCYTSGIEGGEALLGPLPEQTRIMHVWDDAEQTYLDTFIDDETGTQSLADPRLKDWPIDHEEYHEQLKWASNPLSIDTEFLRGKGVDIQSFTLI